jgi:TPR repeat protein
MEVTNQTNAKAKQEQLESLKELKKGYKEIKDLQTTNASLRSELNKIKSEKTKAIEVTNQTNAKANQEQIASINDKPSELNTGSVSFPEDTFNIAPYEKDTTTKAGDHINDSDRLHEAINSLGKKEFSLAHQLFLKLADKGMPEAQINLGMMFENGQGVPQDFKKAIRWYRLAANQGLTKAQEKLNSLLKISPTAQINFDLGVRFETGQEVPQDFREAIRFYRLAADLGHIKAQEKINLILSGQFLEQIKSEKTRRIKATNQAKIREENLSSITEQDFTETNDLHTIVTSLQSELEQIKSDKIRAIEATYRANAKAKLDKLASIKKFENLKKKSFKEIKALQVKTEFLRSELNKIKSDKARAIETANQTKSKMDTMITSKELVSSYLNHWVHSWEKKDIKMYFSFYSKEFKGTKQRHVDWRISRQAAIKTHTNISIQLKNIQISQSKDTVQVNFTQIFKSAGYSDIGIKELIWAKTGNGWRIIEETWEPYQKLSNIGE